MIRQCDRCGAVFTPYRKVISDHEKKPTAFVGVSIGTFNYKTESLENDKTTTYDLCQKCSRQLNMFLENPNITVEQYLNDKVKEDNETVRAGDEDKQKRCNAFGAFDGSVDCLMCQQCDECKKVTNSIKKAISNVEQSAT